MHTYFQCNNFAPSRVLGICTYNSTLLLCKLYFTEALYLGLSKQMDAIEHHLHILNTDQSDTSGTN